MASKLKQQEVNSARIRLDATLQHLVDRKEDSCQGQSESDSSFCQPDSRILPSPKKFSSKANRKRKRRDDSGEYDAVDEQQTVIMKLFDRSVDLAQFPENTSLYPVCRAWINNRPHDKSLGTLAERPPSPEMKKEDEASEEFPNIYELPRPIKSEDGCLYDLRVPEPAPQPKERLNINADPKFAPPAEHLLLNHMARWREVRNRWHTASVMNEMQYTASVLVLKDMFERTMADNM